MKQLSRQFCKVSIILILLISSGYTGILGKGGIDLAKPASASTLQIQFDNNTTANINGDTITFTPDGFNGGGWGDDRPYIGIFKPHSYPDGVRNDSGSLTHTWYLSGMWVPQHIYNQNPLRHDVGWGQMSIYNFTLNSNWVKNLKVGNTVSMLTYYNQSNGDRVFNVGNATVTSVLGGAPPPPTLVYPSTCSSGLTPKGTPGTASFYCEKPTYITSCPTGMTLVGSGANAYCKQAVKQTEYAKPDFVKDINLGDILNNSDFGSTGERADGQFGKDEGSHSNGWHLNGQGESYKSNHVQFNNIPDNGYVNALGNAWQPQFTISQGKTNLDVPREQTGDSLSELQWNNNLTTYKGSGVTTEIIAYRIDDLELLKSIQNSDKGLTDLFTKNGTTYKYQTNLVSTTVDSVGIKDYNNLKVNKSGYYIIASKYIDLPNAKKEMASPSQAILAKHTYYSFLPININFMVDIGYLPIHNNLLAQVNENMLTVGNKKGNHKLSNLSYSTYKSLKVPSAYNTDTNKTVIGSTSGGIQLLDKDLKTQPIIGDSLLINSVKVKDVLSYDNSFYIATDKGVLHLNCKDNKLTATSITESINDLDIYNDSLYLITDTHLYQYFVTDGNLLKSNNEYDLKSMYANPTSKAGRIEIVGDLMTVSTKDEGLGSEVLILTK